jgi:hypothetical protein
MKNAFHRLILAKEAYVLRNVWPQSSYITHQCNYGSLGVDLIDYHRMVAYQLSLSAVQLNEHSCRQMDILDLVIAGYQQKRNGDIQAL